MSYTYEALSPGGHQEMLEEVFSKVKEQVGSYKTASGSLVSFSDGADLPMPSFICNIDAVQDLHGYDAPWVGGAGKNKLPMTVDSIKQANGGATWTGNSTIINGVTFTIQTDSDGNVTGILANGTPSGEIQSSLYIINSNTMIFENNTYILNGVTNGSLNSYYMMYLTTSYNHRVLTNGDTIMSLGGGISRIRIDITNGYTANNLLFKPMVRLSTETDPTFAPYSNICPISGHTGVNAWVKGKNHLPMTVESIKAVNTAGTWSSNAYALNGVTFTILTDSDENVNGIKVNGTASSTATLSFISKAANNYIGRLMNCNGVIGAPASVAIQYFSGDTFQKSYILPDSTTNYEIEDVGNNINIFVRIESGYTANNITFKPMIRLATETDTTYEPYNPQSQTIQVSWQTEAGEVYVGYVDLVSGVLTVLYELKRADWLTWQKNSSDVSSYLYFTRSLIDLIDIDKRNTIKCNATKTMTAYPVSEDGCYVHTNGVLYLNFLDAIGTNNITSFNNFLTTENITLLIPVETPQICQLTPTQIKSLVDDITNAWCDTGDIKIQYQPNNIIAELRTEILALQARVEELEQTE